MTYHWQCDECGHHGFVRVPRHEDGWSGVQRILSAHRQQSDTCRGGRDTVRVREESVSPSREE